ncbi:MAG: L-threonylcarbamoyladenylate synthase [bacterium]|nr:L-threonylcarbamoyladenylate synthase [bacterium]
MKSIKEAIRIIKNGGVIVAPTDTVYGLICDATNQKAVERLFKIKQRPKNKAVPIFVKDVETAKKLAEIDKAQEKFLEKVWPGKITAVLKLKNQRSKLYGVGKITVALRVPGSKLILELLKKTKKPLTGTSANVSGQPASGNVKEVLRQFEGRKYQPDLVIDAGSLPGSNPSKIIDLTVFPYKTLRQ